jgi:glycosyltransferase involved in cell wall biosynthesis
VHAYWALPAGIAAASAARRLRVPAVVTLDSGEFSWLPDIGYGLQGTWRQRAAVSATLRLATRLTVCTRYMERLAYAHGASPTVIPIGVDLARFPRGECPDGPPWRLVHVASLNPVKDHAVLLEAFRQVVHRVHDCHLAVIGEDTMQGRIQQLARDLQLDPHVSFTGFQTTEAVASRLQGAHLHVVSSRHEAAGIVVLEAAACGVATVGTAVGYVADWMPDRAIGVAPGDASGLAGAIIATLGDSSRRRALASAARDWTIAHDADWTAAAFERLYESAS